MQSSDDVNIHSNYTFNSDTNYKDTFNQITWSLTWTLAFPTLLPTRLFTSDGIGADERFLLDTSISKHLSIKGKNEICKHTTIEKHAKPFTKQQEEEKTKEHILDRKETISENHDLSISLGLIAFREIFGYDSGVETVQKMVSIQHEGSEKKENDILDGIDSKFSSPPSVDSQDNNLGYGEITPLAVMKLIARVQYYHEHYPNENFKDENFNMEGGTIIDLGSGTGRVLFAAALMHSFDHVIGIEIMEDLHREALENRTKWEKYHPFSIIDKEDKGNNLKCLKNENLDKSTRPLVKKDSLDYDKVVEQNKPQHLLRTCAEFNFLHEDITTYSEPISRPSDDSHYGPYTSTLTSIISSLSPQKLNIILIHGTLFDAELMHSIQKICQNCPKGAFFITVTKPLSFPSSREENPSSVDDTDCTFSMRGIYLLEESEKEMTWGMGTVYIQRSF